MSVSIYLRNIFDLDGVFNLIEQELNCTITKVYTDTDEGEVRKVICCVGPDTSTVKETVRTRFPENFVD